MGTPICRLYQLNLVNLTVHIPRQGRRRVPFSTRNSQATLNRHNNLTGPFIRSPMDIFHQQYSLTACHFIFVLHATRMSWDDLSFTNSPPQPKFSIRATTSFNTSAHQAIHQSSTVTSSTHIVFKQARSPPHLGNFSYLLLLSSASFNRYLLLWLSLSQTTMATALVRFIEG